MILRLVSLLLLVVLGTVAVGQQKSYRLPGVSLKEQVIWGSSLEVPEVGGLAFGGQDQQANDGNPHTRIKENSEWKSIYAETLDKSPLKLNLTVTRSLARFQKDAGAQARLIYFKGLPADEEIKLARTIRIPFQDCATLAAALNDLAAKQLKGAESEQARRAAQELELAAEIGKKLLPALEKGVTPEAIQQLRAAQIHMEKAAGCLDVEPQGRALSPLVYDPKTKLFVLFGGDHLDYLTNDTWVFDLVAKRWTQRHPKSAPPPRANHTLKAAGDGKIVLSGGYTYTSSTDYVGGQYRDHGDGEWVYDVEKNIWTGPKEGVPAESRVYRSGPFYPDFYLTGLKPEAASFQTVLKQLPVNTWVKTQPPQLPRLNRDWGSAVLDTERDLILRFSGGHSAHGGTDVLHYHLATNRWELPFPVEFPLGQTYSNTEYPEGFNFNLRPWVTGHTYQNYGFDPIGKKLVFTGRHTHSYVYDPTVGDWIARYGKPQGMVYNSCFYTLTLCPTPTGLICWTQNGGLFRYDSGNNVWVDLKPKGKLLGSIVDNSTMVHDSRRNRLLFFRKQYGDKTKYDGTMQAVDLKTLEVSTLTPPNAAAAADVPYLCQIRYDAANDLLLVGGTLPPGSDGLRRTPAYDPSGNRWVSLKITGDDPSGKNGRNVSLGLMYDARRQLFWAVDTNSQVYVLKLNPATADVQAMK